MWEAIISTEDGTGIHRSPIGGVRDTGMSPCLAYELTTLSCQSSESMREEEYHIGLADSAERVER